MAKYHQNKLNLSHKDARAIEMKAETYRRHLNTILEDMRDQEFGLDTDDQNWMIKRAFQDGKVSIIRTLMKIVGEKE